MATPTEINDFKATIEFTQAKIANTICNILSIEGRAENEELLNKLKLIDYYVDNLIDYFSQDPYNTYNFFTVDEIQEVIRHFNELCNTDYNINL